MAKIDYLKAYINKMQFLERRRKEETARQERLEEFRRNAKKTAIQ